MVVDFLLILSIVFINISLHYTRKTLEIHTDWLKMLSKTIETILEEKS